MKKSGKIALLVAIALTVVGLAVMFFAMLSVGFDFRRLDSSKYVSKTQPVTIDFDRISVELNVSDLEFVLTEDDTCRVELYENEKTPHTVTMDGETLVIRETDERKWYDHIGFQFDSAKVTVYLPKKAYDKLTVVGDTSDVTVPTGMTVSAAEISLSTGDVAFYATVGDFVSIKTTTGDVTVADIGVKHTATLTTETGEITLRSVTASAVCFETDTGDVELDNVNCEQLTGKSDTGDISLDNVIVTGHLNLESDTGDVELERCDAATLSIRTSTGDVEGTLLSAKVFHTDTSTGDVVIDPYTTEGGRCEIFTSTGDIHIRIEK